MNIYIFENVTKTTHNWDEGGVVVVAADIEQVKKLLRDTGGRVNLSDDDLSRAIVYPLQGEHEAKIFVFPDTGY
jgi:ribosomal protein S6